MFLHDDIKDLVEAVFRNHIVDPKVFASFFAFISILLITLLSAESQGQRKFHLSKIISPDRRAVAMALLTWLLLGSLQNIFPDFSFLYAAGYIILPLVHFTLWVFVFRAFGKTIKSVLAGRRFLVLAMAAAIAYAAFYLWSTNLISAPDPEDMPPANTPAFIVPYQSFGPLANWPNIEFWIPRPAIFGAVSIGTAIQVFSLAGLFGISMALLGVSLTKQRASLTGGGAVGGSTFIAMGTNFCCCCTPAVYPVMSIVFGSSAASSLIGLMMGSNAPLYNLTQIGALWVVIAAIARLSHAIRPQLFPLNSATGVNTAVQ